MSETTRNGDARLAAALWETGGWEATSIAAAATSYVMRQPNSGTNQ